MQDKIFEFISTTFGVSAAVALAVILLAFWLTHYITKRVTEIKMEQRNIRESQDSHVKKVGGISDDVSQCKSSVDALRSESTDHKKRMDSLSDDVSFCKATIQATNQMAANIDEIRRDLSYLKGSLDIMKSSTSSLMQSHSPISLTEEGRKVVREMDAEDIISADWLKISRATDQVADKTPYDIQQFCIENVSVDPERFLSEESLNRVKGYAFAKGQPLQLYLRVIGLLIRDRLLASKGIDLSEIDKTAPNR